MEVMTVYNIENFIPDQEKYRAVFLGYSVTITVALSRPVLPNHKHKPKSQKVVQYLKIFRYCFFDLSYLNFSLNSIHNLPPEM